MSYYPEERRRPVLHQDDLQAIKEMFDAHHPCSSFTDPEVHALKEAIKVLTAENVQTFKDILAVFRDGRKTLWGGVKLIGLVVMVFLLWLAYKTGFLVDRMVK